MFCINQCCAPKKWPFPTPSLFWGFFSPPQQKPSPWGLQGNGWNSGPGTRDWFLQAFESQALGPERSEVDTPGTTPGTQGEPGGIIQTMAKAVEAFFFSDHGFFQMLLFFGNPNTIHGTSLVHFTENPWHGWCVWPGDFFQWSAWLCRDFLVAIPILSGDLHWPYDITKKLPAYVISLSQWLTFKQIGDFIFSRRKVYKFKLFSWPIGWVGSIRIPPNQSGFHGMSAKIFECCLLLLMAETRLTSWQLGSLSHFLVGFIPSEEMQFFLNHQQYELPTYVFMYFGICSGPWSTIHKFTSISWMGIHTAEKDSGLSWISMFGLRKNHLPHQCTATKK